MKLRNIQSLKEKKLKIIMKIKKIACISELDNLRYFSTRIGRFRIGHSYGL